VSPSNDFGIVESGQNLCRSIILLSPHSAVAPLFPRKHFEQGWTRRLTVLQHGPAFAELQHRDSLSLSLTIHLPRSNMGSSTQPEYNAAFTGNRNCFNQTNCNNTTTNITSVDKKAKILNWLSPLLSLNTSSVS